MTEEIKHEYMKTPHVTVDCVVFHRKAVVLIRRGNEPFKGEYALPGGFVDIGESVETACKREAEEETGLKVHGLELVGVYSEPGRDPRRHTVSVAFLADADITELRAGSDAVGVELVEDWGSVPIAFDHKIIIRDAWKKSKNQR